MIVDGVAMQGARWRVLGTRYTVHEKQIASSGLAIEPLSD
jgi:hypothetical protein